MRGSYRKIYLCDALLQLLKKYKIVQFNNQKKYKDKYHNYYLEELKNKYDKLV